MMRDYEYLQQRAFLRVDVLQQRVEGVAEVVLAPKAMMLKMVRLHARQLRVKRVLVNGLASRFEQLDFLSEIVDEAYRDFNTFDLFYRGAIVASKEGELIIHMPPDVHIVSAAQTLQRPDTSLSVSTNVDESAVKEEAADAAAQADDEAEDEEKEGEQAQKKSPSEGNHEACKEQKRKQRGLSINNVESDNTNSLSSRKWDLDTLPASTTSYAPLVVRVEYELENPSGGIRFVLPTVEKPNRSPHMYTYCGPFGGLCDGARTWMPCRDTLRDTCPFRLELTVPYWCVAIACGEMVQQLINQEDQTRTFRYVINSKTNCSSVGFAVGPFRMYIPPDMPRMTHFALPESDYDDLVYCTSKLASTMEYFEQSLRASYPFETYQQVFVEDPPEECQYFAGASILDQNLLHGPRIIDRELPSHLVQVKSLIGSWIAGAVGIQTTKDAWVLIGVIGHLVNTYVRNVYGEEEYGYRIQMAMDALTTMELTSDTQSPALLSSEVDVYAEYDPCLLPFIEVKAPLVLHMIEQRVGHNHLSIAIQRVVAGSSGNDASSNEKGTTDKENGSSNDKKDGDQTEDEAQIASATSKSSSASSGVMPLDALSTYSFLKTVKIIAGSAAQDLTKSFLNTWIVKAGMPFFTVGYWYNRKQTQAEVVLQQEVPPGGELFTGDITITIVEDTSEYPYVKRVENRRHKWDFPCHSKVRKKRRKRQGLEDPDDSVSVNGPGMGLNDTPVFWVKIDTGCAWLRHVVMHQPDFNWMEQLLSDKKVGSRVHAARALALFHQPNEKPNVVSVRVLTECMSGLTTHSRRLRAEASLSLGIWQSIHASATNANTNLPEWKAMHNLFRIFKEHFFDRSTDMPLPNYFLPSGGKVLLESLGAQHASLSSKEIQVQDYAAGEYEIKKTIPKALSTIKARNGKTPVEIENFLLQLLVENDNSKNYVEMDDQSQVVDDCFYIGHIVLALSWLRVDRSVAASSSIGLSTSTTTGTGGSNGSAPMSADERVVKEIVRYLNYDQVQPSHNRTITVCCLEALCNLMIEGRCSVKQISFFEYAGPSQLNVVRKAAIESIIRLLFAEDPQYGSHPTTSGYTPMSARSANVNSQLFGPAAALEWVGRLLEAEGSAGIRSFAVQVCLNCFRGFPPGVAAQVLATWDHAYTLNIMRNIQMKNPWAFIQKSPEKSEILDLFDVPALTSLRDDSVAAKRIVEEYWKLMNSCTAYDQKLRVALLVMYKRIWGEGTPIAVAHTVQNKSANWAGGFESLRLMVEESKNRRNNAMGGSGPTNGGGNIPQASNAAAGSAHSGGSSFKQHKLKEDESQRLSSSSTSLKRFVPSPSPEHSLDHLKGPVKRIKLKVGETLLHAQKL